MNVSLIDYTGMGHPDPMRAGRLLAYTKNTRLTQGEGAREVVARMSEEELLNELEYISNTIRSSWEFVDFVFEITGVSRAFTHQFVRTRTGSFAQQSMRSVDMQGFDYITGPSIEGDERLKRSYGNMMKGVEEAYNLLKDYGAEVEDARGILPTNISTSIIAKFNLRTLADMAPKRENPRAQGEYTHVFKAMIGEVLRVMPWTEKFIYPDRLQTPQLDKIIKDALGGKTPFTLPEVNAALKELDKLKGAWG